MPHRALRRSPVQMAGAGAAAEKARIRVA